MRSIEAEADSRAAGLRRIASSGLADACFFRSRAKPGHRKALLQVTERCDLRCAHCFVSATATGADMALADVEASMERLRGARVANVTLTGGEPFVHPQMREIVTLLVGADMDVTICTNAVSITDSDHEFLSGMGRVAVNVSLDGFAPESHGRFRGDPASFEATVRNAEALAERGLLKGILSTPNALAAVEEYEALHRFAADLGAEYVLMNPLSSFGRGFFTRDRLRADDQVMLELRSRLSTIETKPGPEKVYIRFPNSTRPLTGCIAGEIFYVFVNGDTAICPYLVFAARNRGSRHTPEEFLVGNLFQDADIAERLDGNDFHDRYTPGANAACKSCDLRSDCGCGCPAAVVGRGLRLGDLDEEVCPIAGDSA